MLFSTTYTIKQMATLLSVQPDTLHRWEREGALVPEKTGKGGKKVYTDKHYRYALDNLIPNPKTESRGQNEKYAKYTREQLVNELKSLKKKKQFGLVWEEYEKEAVVERCKHEAPVLQHQAAKRIFTDKNKPTNVFIEGDNYHALQVLNYTHAGKIDVIYIDPPYNTGASDWTYNNNYINKKDSFRHSKWLNMMKPRLTLARSLLSKNGVLICAIDENERATLELLIKELFPNHEVTCVSISHNPQGIQGDNFSYTHEYAIFVIPHKNRISKVDVSPRKQALRDDTGNSFLRTNARNCFYPIFIKDDSIIGFGDVPDDDFHPKDRVVKKQKHTEIWPIRDGVERKWVYARQSIHQIQNDLFIKETKRGKDIFRVITTGRPKTVWADPKYQAGGKYGTKLLRAILPKAKFDYPKSLHTVLDALRISTDKDSTVLDFFAGSGTTGHAVLELNEEDGGNRKFILCTNNENHNGNGSGGIAEAVCYPRIKKIIQGYRFAGNETKELYSKEFKNYTHLKKLDMKEIESIKNNNRTQFDKVSVRFEDGILRVEGKNNIDKQKEGLGGNLEYFKTAFIDVENIQSVPDDKKLDFTHEAGRILALKEDCFNEIKCNKHYQIFTNDVGKHVGIYFREDTSQLKELEGILLSKPEVKMYIFAYDANPESHKRYVAYDNVTVEDIPEPILKVYREVNL